MHTFVFNLAWGFVGLLNESVFWHRVGLLLGPPPFTTCAILHECAMSPRRGEEHLPHICSRELHAIIGLARSGQSSAGAPPSCRPARSLRAAAAQAAAQAAGPIASIVRLVTQS